MNEMNSPESPRPSQSLAKVVVNVFAVALTCGAIAWASDLFRRVGLQIYTQQYLSGMPNASIPLVYLHVPAGEGRERTGRVPWYDAVAAVIGFAAASYTSIRYPLLAELVVERPLDGFLVGLAIVLLVLEGLRRTAGKVLTSVVLFFIAFGLLGHLVPGTLEGRPVPFDNLIYYMAWDPTALYGTPMIIVATIVPAFVFFGQVLFRSGGASFFTDISMVLMGRYRGGPAKISVFASGLFGSISGSVVSNVVTTGVITIPLMKRGGYRPHIAGAIEAVASCGGQLMPPIMGATAFLMAEFLGIPYTDVVIASLIPAFLYYVALFMQADLEAARMGISRVEEALIPSAKPVLKAGWFFPVPFVVIVGALFWLNYTPETSAFLGALFVIICTVLLGYKGKRLNISAIVGVLRSTGIAVLEILMIGAAAGMVIGVLNISGLGFGLTIALIQLAGGNLIILLLMAAFVCILLGMGMPTTAVYVLVATLVAPALTQVGIEAISAHLFVLYFGMMSMITPPVAIGSFAAATLAEAPPMRTGFASMRFGWFAFVVPFLYISSMTYLMRGHPLQIVIDLITAIGGVWLVCVALIGYFVRPIGFFERLLTAAAGLALLTPAKTYLVAVPFDLIGFVVGAFLIGRQWIMHRRLQRAV